MQDRTGQSDEAELEVQLMCPLLLLGFQLGPGEWDGWE